MRKVQNLFRKGTMKKACKKVVATAMAAAMVVGMVTPPTVQAANDITYEVSTESSNITNLMSQFGFIGFNSVTTQGHQHMNMATKSLNGGGGEYCIRQTYTNGTSTNYIQNLPAGDIKIGYSRDTLVVGEEHAVTSNGSENFIDGRKVESAGTVKADTATHKYMNLENLQQNFQAYVNQLASLPSSVTMENKRGNSTDVTVDFSDQNAQKIYVNASSGTNVVNLTPQDFANPGTGFNVEFAKTNTSAILVINIDMQGATVFDCKQVRTKVAGIDYDTGEAVWDKNTNRVYLNFYDSTKPNGIYSGEVKFTDESTGTIIAPYANVTVGSNWCGMLVGNNVRADGESHRTNPYNPVPAIGKTPDDEKPKNKTGEITFKGTKTVEGTGAPSEVYTFIVNELGVGDVATGTVTGAGNIQFQTIKYGKNDLGDHVYKITEYKGDTPGMKYDTSSKRVTVSVKDPGAGTEGLLIQITGDSDVITFNNVYTPVKKTVKISKQAVGGGAELAGAKLTVKNSAGAVVESWTSGASKKEISLADGIYTLTETTAPDGYEIAESITFKVEKGVVSVKSGSTYTKVTDDTVVMLDAKKGKTKVKISKQAVGGGSELVGAKLVVKNSSGTQVASWTSGTSKKEIELVDGTYTLTETTAPDGYEVAETMTFKIEKGVVYVKDGSSFKQVTDSTVVMYDNFGKKKVKISKQAVGGGSELAGAKLVVKNSSGTQVASWTSGTSKKEIELAEGTYTLTETTAPDGYEVAETMTFKIEKGVVYVETDNGFVKVTDSTVVMYDAKKGKKLVKISKQEVGGGAELAGAKLTVKDSTGKEVASWTSGTSKKEIQLEEGTYTLTEVTAPDGYEVAETITFKVEKDAVSVKKGSTFTKVTDDTVVMYDAYGKKKVKISKQAVGGGAELAGAKLTVKDSNGQIVKSWTSGSAKQEIELAEGTYTLTETTAPNGYEIAETMTFKIEKGVVYVKDGSSFKKVTSDTVVMYDAKKGKKTVKISKQAVGGGAELAGAKLTVKDSTGKEVASWTSGTSKKEIQLEEGIYTLTEITAPDGYEVAETMTFKIEKGDVSVKKGATYEKVTDDTVVMIDNYGKKKVNISKQAVGGGSELAGAKLTVKNSSGTVVTSWTSGSTKKTIELAEGTYTLTEVTAPNGYEVAETITFKVEKAVVYVKDGSSFKKVTDDTVVMLDAKKGMKKVKISKQAVGGGEELVGAKLTVKDSKGQVVKSWTSSATKQELELAEGVYTLTETTAPDGYEIAETMTFKIEKGVVSVKEGTTYKQVTGDTVVMYDKFGKKKVKISKQAVGGGSELAGAKLTVKDSTGKEVASWTSGTSKKEIELAEGTYTLTEVTAPNGFEVAETMTFKIEKAEVYVKDGSTFKKVTDDTVVMYDAYGKKKVKISKQAVGGGAELAGAKLTVKDSTGKEVSSWTSGTSKKEIELAEGTYTLTETTAPDGYEVAETMTFKIEKGIVYVKDGSAFKKVTDDTVVMLDAKKGKKIVKISKQAVGGGSELAGAKLIVKDNTGKEVKSWISGTAKQEIELEEGVYTLTEITAPDGFEIAETITFKIEKGEVSVKNGAVYTKVTDSTVVMYDAYGKKVVKISKQAVGGGSELAGAKLTVKDSTGKEVASWTSGTSKKEITLAEGVYSLTEVTAPNGYEIAETITFKIDHGVIYVKDGSSYVKVTSDTVVMYDAQKGNTKVNISKQAVGGGKELAGAKLTVKGSDGSIKESWTSGTTQKVIELEEGTYTLTEITAPKGYEIAETITFKVEKGEVFVQSGDTFKKVTTVVMYDAPSDEKTTEEKTTEKKTTEKKKKDKKTTEKKTTEKKTTEKKTTEEKTSEEKTKDDTTDPDKGKLVVTVIDEKTNKPVPGATVEVTGPDGNKQTIVTNSNGQRVLNNRDVGNYKVTVKKVPDGYNVTTDTAYTTNVVEGEKTSVTFKVDKKDTGHAEDTPGDKKTTDSAQTGDHSPIAILFTVMMVTLSAFVVLMFRRRKNS